MRTIELDDELVAETVRATGAKSEREAIEAALRLQLSLENQKRGLRELWGSFDWQGDLEDSRLSHGAVGVLRFSGEDAPILAVRDVLSKKSAKPEETTRN